MKAGFAASGTGQTTGSAPPSATDPARDSTAGPIGEPANPASATGDDRTPRLPDGSFWLFGYGSLIWRPDLAWVERRRATLRDWSRRFWQGSHDHRGTPTAPGRVVTLVETPGQHCTGMAYRVAPQAAERVLGALDHREKNGYERHAVTLHSGQGCTLRALVYVAAVDNFAWLGPAPEDEIAAQIARARGPSGANRDYLLELAAALQALGVEDDHVTALAARVPAQ